MAMRHEIGNLNTSNFKKQKLLYSVPDIDSLHVQVTYKYTAVKIYIYGLV